MASQALCAFGAGVYACVCLVDDRFVYLLECVCVVRRVKAELTQGRESERLTERRTALIWLDTELEAWLAACVALLPAGGFAIDQGLGCFAASKES